MDFGYINFFGIKCTYTQDKLDFYLIPSDDSKETNFYRFRNKENFILPFKSDIYDNCCIYVERVIIGYSNKILLKAKYVSKQLPNEGICMYTLVGDEVDEFFSPIDYFFPQKRSGNYTPTDVLYSATNAATYSFMVESKAVQINLTYGNALSSGIRSDLKIHPILNVTFDSTSDTFFIYKTLKIIIRFMQFVRRQRHYNFRRLELFGNIDDKIKHVGFLYESLYDLEQTPHSHCDASFKLYNDSISPLLQIIADEQSFPIAHLPTYDYEIYNYSPQRFAAIFSAFEYECSRNKDKYEINMNQDLYMDIKNKITEYIADLTPNNEYEQEFRNWAKERIGQLGSQLGQQRKIVNAYEHLSAYLIHSMEHLIWHNNSVKEIATKLTSLRGKILHNEMDKELTEKEIECIRFLDILQFIMILKRAGVSVQKVEFIIGEIYHCNSTYIESL